MFKGEMPPPLMPGPVRGSLVHVELMVEAPMALFSKLFGGGDRSAPEPVEHAGFRILVEPVQEAGGYRVGARIEKDVGGQTRTHMLIRADTYQSADAAAEASLAKAKQAIDQLGDSLFD